VGKELTIENRPMAQAGRRFGWWFVMATRWCLVTAVASTV